MSKKSTAARRARDLFLGCELGVLSTHSADIPGYPFGSIAPYCADRGGRPVVLISRIAQHTKNVQADARVSLIAFEQGAGDSQAHGRVTCIGDLRRVPDDDTETATRYYRHFPDAAGYHETHDFDFWVLDIQRVRFIGGFGDINWIESGKFVVVNPFTADQESGAIEHMNADHGDAIITYCSCAGIALADGERPVLVGLDGEGMTVRTGGRNHRIAYSEPVADSTQLRQRLTAMASVTQTSSSA